MEKVAIIGAGITKFGKRDDSTLTDLLFEASVDAIKDAKIECESITSLFVANMASGVLNKTLAVASALVDQLSIVPASADRIENGPASGGSAIRAGYAAIASGLTKCCLVVGGEKMTHKEGSEITSTVAMILEKFYEEKYGISLPAFAALLTRLYLEKYKVPMEDITRVAVKNHKNGVNNPIAHFQKEISLDKAMSSAIISDPLRLFDCCPVSDGAAALILVNGDLAQRYCDKPVFITGSGQATDYHAVCQRPDPLHLKAVELSANQAFSMAKRMPQEVHVAELHDAFTILEILESEYCGFFEPGKGTIALKEGITELNGKIPINPSGGLKARGHPWGATGVAQAYEIVKQLQGKANNQVQGANIGFSINFGGFGNNIVAHVFENEIAIEQKNRGKN
jgi:acetyl-CoA C-acetyltransferase